MALPKWITPVGNLGILSELEYFEYQLDAYDATGGTLKYSRISGKLPPGIQITPDGSLRGVPVSELGGDLNVNYSFTLRVQNINTKDVADRSFEITITNVAPPIINPRNVDLGVYLDGTVVNLQLEAIEFTPSASLTWSIKGGALPLGLSFSSTGLLSGYVEPVPVLGPGSHPNWDITPWSELGWDFPLNAVSKTFTFRVEVFDGVNYDLSDYKINVFPRGSLTADNNVLTVDIGRLNSGEGLSDIDGTKHIPIILTPPDGIPAHRQGSYFSFNVEAVDLDGDTLEYIVNSASSGSFDEEIIIGPSYPYVASTPVNGNLFVGCNSISQATEPALVPTNIIKVLNNSGTWSLATVNTFTTVQLRSDHIVTGTVGQSVTQLLNTVTGTITSVSNTSGFITLPGIISVSTGDIITQGSASANVTANVFSVGTVPVTFTSGTFISNVGNISVNGTSILMPPESIDCYTNISVHYTGSDVFMLGTANATVIINSVDTLSYPVKVISVGVTMGSLAPEPALKFDSGRYSQGVLALPAGLTINTTTGWITGQLPSQTINELQYQFEIAVQKHNDPIYRTLNLYNFTVLGDLNNRIDWITNSDLGTIENGSISDFSLIATSSLGRPLYYEMLPHSMHRLPQGVILTTDGLLSGRVSFELFGLDNTTTTIDNGATDFDTIYSFTVQAVDYSRSISANRTFTIRVVNRSTKPYEDLYFKALLSSSQRALFQTLMIDNSIFPSELIYRPADPFFGVASEIKTLFLPGITASVLADYMSATSNNHFSKKLVFGDIKTAAAIDANFNTKYEVVYVEITDGSTASAPASSTNLATIIKNPYYDINGNSYTTIHPNALDNMKSEVVNTLGYENKGALPDWMTSKQPNGRVLGFTRAVVLAYTIPGASSKIAYRLVNQNFNFNQIDFTVDRYQLDNSYSQNFDIPNQRYLTSTETTFDRYPSLSSIFNKQGVVTFAVSGTFETINNRLLSDIKSTGGFDGYKNIKDGDTLVFAVQEFTDQHTDIADYNRGWSNVTTLWDSEPWAYNIDTTDDDITSPDLDATPGLAWDHAIYVPGYNEHNLNPLVDNQRIGIWKVNLGIDNIISLSFVQSMNYNYTIYVQNGFTYGGTTIYYDPVVKPGNLLPNYSIIPQQVSTTYTRFDGNGTRFFDHRNSYTVPNSGDKYIKFSKLGVFN
jgi:hypothetical protein